MQSVKGSTGFSIPLEASMSKNQEQWMEWILRFLLIGISSFAVTYLRDIGKETSILSAQLLELRYEIKRLAENQIEMNTQFARQLEKLGARVDQIEKELEQ